MPDFFDSLPLDHGHPLLRELVDLLVANIDDQDDIKQIAKRAGMLTGGLSFKKAPGLLWPALLDAARAQILHHQLLEQVKHGRAALARRINEIFSAKPPIAVIPKPVQGPLSEGWQGRPEVLLAAKSTLLDIDFLRCGLLASKAVCKLTASSSKGDVWYGSAFLIAPDLLLSNYHVLFSDEGYGPPASSVEALFQYETGVTPVAVGCKVETIVGDAKYDWAVIRLSGALPVDCAPLHLGSARPLALQDPVFIVQHPAGGPKKIGLYRNEIRHFDDDVVQYLTDTQGGSSGSPVFNDRWEVVALHHRWIRADGEAGELRNQGVRIDRVIEGLKDKGFPVSDK